MTDDQKWIKARVDAVSERYTTYDALIEAGVKLIDRDTELQISCPWHGPDNTPSARYYAGQDPHFHCFACKLHMRGIDIFAKLHGINFMQALSELERRFGIKVTESPETDIKIPVDKSGVYESHAWSDIPRVIDMMESKLLRMKNHVSLIDYVKWCRVLDAIRWDLDHNGGHPLPQMATVLVKLRNAMDGSKMYADL
jgi:hypothetical protein